MIYKIKWFISAIILKLFLKNIGFPSYFSFPIFSKGLGKVSFGKRARIFPGSRFEVHGTGSIQIGDNVGIGQNFHITSAGKLIIGNDVVISANVFVTNIDHIYDSIDVPVLEQGNRISETVVGDNSFIGIGVAIQAGTKLGKNTIVGANSVVRGEFPDYVVLVGAPARIVKRYDFKSNNWLKTDSEGNFK